MVIFMLVLIGEQSLLWTGHLLQIWTLFSPDVLKIILRLNPSPQNLGFVARFHLLEICLQSEKAYMLYTRMPSQAGKFWSPRASLVMINFLWSLCNEMQAIAGCFWEYRMKDKMTCSCFLELRGGLGPN